MSTDTHLLPSWSLQPGKDPEDCVPVSKLQTCLSQAGTGLINLEAINKGGDISRQD